MKSRQVKMTASLLLVLLAFGCAHHQDVRPMESGTHYVAIKTERKDEGFHEAIRQAHHYCSQFQKSAVQVSEGSEYIGGMDEGSYNNAKTISNVAKAAGTIGYVFGGKKESNIGGVAAVGGVVTDEALGEGYRYTMHFKCQ